MKLPFQKKKPYRIGVALSGGGARGFAHIGAMRAIEDLGLAPDIIAGVSAGSVVATFYASGLLDRNNDKLLELFSGGKFTDFATPVIPREGFFSMQRFIRQLRKTIPYKNIEELPLKTIICATDLDAGTKAIFDQGELAPRVAASSCVPIVFEPIEIDGRKYVDGGVLRNLPAYAIRHLCDFLIGVNCSPMGECPPAKSIVDIAKRSYRLMSKNNVIQDLEMCDAVVTLSETAHHQTFDLSDLELLVESGYLSTLKQLKPLSK
ncbi:MAG: patatin-like phospholipase family protein [Bacteroides sp.]|nr:patatin-like phospholipase family protein [Bacteroides sp.]MBD5351741.1 patatin-like phospholipase family protein [Bacteroides sp.]